MADELPTRYDPSSVEPRWIDAWESEQVGRADPESEAAKAGRTFMIAIPPPNVTGVLHMGHALNNTLQDIVIRMRRMQGYEALWLPGTDHAGIATQAVVARKLQAERGLGLEEIGREAFVEKVWEWKDHHGDRILAQLRRMGCSCDWSRTRFTLEPRMSRAVREAFVRLYDKGFIYRGARLVNWDCHARTAISEDEIEYVARKAKLYYLRYPVVGEEGTFLTVATTRPETMLADTGVAVHPDDERFGRLVGRTVQLPLTDREIPVVADESVDPKFGTGAVKVTPGHDPADYERGMRAGLAVLNLMNEDGTLNELGGRFAGLDREVARREVVKALDELGLLEKVEDLEHNVATSHRSGTAIEPLISTQWFVKMDELAGPAIDAVSSGALEFRPARWSKVYLDWLENVRDWCISRQLWWGHRIPVWYDEDEVPVASREDLEIGAPHPVTGKPITHQEEDVLDTWASSWLWPFATLGWPDVTQDVERFYPTQFLSTARDIIYLWVARMVMAGYEFLDHLPPEQRCPFSVCYIHATILDKQGRRMSKSLGNGIDPLEMIEQYGADAMRFTLAYITTEGQDLKLDPVRFEMGRNFMNKVWNAARFTLQALEGWVPAQEHPELAPEDRWILTELTRTRRLVTELLDGYRFNNAMQALYEFTWNSFCDWYLELAKPRLEDTGPSGEAVRGTLVQALAGLVKLLHPVTPHITEEIWSHLAPWTGRSGLLAREDWGSDEFEDASAADGVEALQEAVKTIRNLRQTSRVPEKEQVDVLLAPIAGGEHAAEALRPLAAHAARLARCSALVIDAGATPPATNASALLSFATVYVDLEGKIDLEAERKRLQAELERAQKAVAVSEKKLANEKFVQRAKPEVVELERRRLADHQATVERVTELLANLA